MKVALTLGHSASHRPKADLTGSGDYTHDWSFYVRGDPGCKIHNYIDRVVFKLHDTFPNPVQGLSLRLLVKRLDLPFNFSLMLKCYSNMIMSKCLTSQFSILFSVIKKPPYEIHEQGYGTFILAVEVNFKNKREPRKIE